MREPWVGKLIDQYTITKRGLEAYRQSLKGELATYKEQTGETHNPTLDEEIKAIGSMISSMSYSLTWMRSGREPGALRGADRRSVYEHTVVLDTDIFPSLMAEPEDELTNDQKRQITEVLLRLSQREVIIFIFNTAYGMSQREIASEMGLSRRRVRDCLSIARRKLEKFRENMG